jgi:hypothetical protein
MSCLIDELWDKNWSVWLIPRMGGSHGRVGPGMELERGAELDGHELTKGITRMLAIEERLVPRIAHPHLLLRATCEQFLQARATSRVGLASESHWLQPVLVLTVH